MLLSNFVGEYLRSNRLARYVERLTVVPDKVSQDLEIVPGLVELGNRNACYYFQ
jgi:hypothetical protein